MNLEPIIQAIEVGSIERPPELWEADSTPPRLTSLLDAVIDAATRLGAARGEITLNFSNVVMMPDEDEEEMHSYPRPGEYVGLTIRGPVNFGPDDTWHPGRQPTAGVLQELADRLASAGASFAYVRRLPGEGSVTVWFRRSNAE